MKIRYEIHPNLKQGIAPIVPFYKIKTIVEHSRFVMESWSSQMSLAEAEARVLYLATETEFAQVEIEGIKISGGNNGSDA